MSLRLCLHRSKNLAYCRVGSKFHYFGTWGKPELVADGASVTDAVGTHRNCADGSNAAGLMRVMKGSPNHRLTEFLATH